jgi:hypothetical protein
VFIGAPSLQGGLVSTPGVLSVAIWVSADDSRLGLSMNGPESNLRA